VVTILRGFSILPGVFRTRQGRGKVTSERGDKHWQTNVGNIMLRPLSPGGGCKVPELRTLQVAKLSLVDDKGPPLKPH
jgi:hypothetical protein